MKNYEKLQVTDEEALKFIGPAVHVVDNYVIDSNGAHLSDEHRVREIMRVSSDMAAGSVWTKGKYLLIGGIMGAIYLGAGMLGYSFGKKDGEA